MKYVFKRYFKCIEENRERVRDLSSNTKKFSDDVVVEIIAKNIKRTRTNQIQTVEA